MATPTPRTIVSAVRAFARRHDLLRPGPLVVAVSGGTDSTALALILAELADEFGLVLHVAHFDHRTRPRASAADAAFAATLAGRIGAPVRVGRADARPASEDAARVARYAFLRRVAEQVGATAIATGHTLDDQAETVLLHLVRGSGITGAAGMRPLRDGIARPLLAVGREETARICAAAGIAPRDDPSNRSLRFARNRVRLRVLPELERINPQTRAALARFAEAAAEVEAAPEDLPASLEAESAPPAVTERSGLVRVIDIGSLPRTPAARARALADAWRAATGRTLGARHRQALLGLASSATGTRRLDLPGGAAVREYERLRFAVSAFRGLAESKGKPAPAPAAAPLRAGATVDWEDWRIALGAATDGLAYQGAVDAATAAALAVRGRRPGDRIAGRGKLQDLFVNAKVPVRLRDTWPVITLNDTVIWVPGVTPPPRGGEVAIAAGPRGTGQVASMSEVRPKGEKRGTR